MKSIKEMFEKVKPFYMLILSLVLGSILFGLGRLSGLSEKKTPISVKYEVANVLESTTSDGSESNLLVSTTSNSTSVTKVKPKQVIVLPTPKGSEEVIGSKSGKKYYYPWCGTVKRIKPENQIHFYSIELAKAAGFTPGGNCKGLK